MNSTKVWIAVDKDGSEIIFADKPVRDNDDNSWVAGNVLNDAWLNVPNNTAFKLTGLRLTWEHETVCIG